MKKTLILILSIISTFALSFLVNHADLIVVDAAVPSGYYSSTEGLNGTALLNELATITKNHHKTYTTYDNIKTMNAKSDPDPNKSGYLLDFYSRISVSANWDGGNTWNREHVWPQSLSGGLYGTSGAGSDIHHIRPTISSINSSRGNKLFTDFDLVSASGTAKYHNSTLVAYQNNSYWEPLDNVKGDTARIIMYMYMHYSKEVSANANYNKAGNLQITSVIYAGGGKEAAFDLLCYWNELDPVDAYESNRNEYCASVTGTRNPFIDNPDFANRIWDYEGGSNTPNPTTYTVTYEVGNATFNYNDTTKYTAGSKINVPNVKPELLNHTFEGWYKDEACKTKWNFDTDTINSNLTLYAKFSENKPLDFAEIFKSKTIKSQLTFDVEMIGGLPGNYVEKTVTINNVTAGEGAMNSISEVNLADYVEFDTSLFDIQYKKNEAVSAYIKANGQIRLYPGNQNGTSIEITAKGDVRISNVEVIIASDSYVDPDVSIATDGSNAIIQNKANGTSGNQSRILGFVITYEQGEGGSPGMYNYIENSLFLNYVLQLSSSEYQSYLSSNDKIKLFVDGVEVEYELIELNNEYRILYRIKIEDINKVYVPKFTYGQLELSLAGYSGKTLAEVYLSQHANDALVKLYVDCLEQILG